MKEMAVAKIGGSILRNPQGMVDALRVLEEYAHIKIVIVSATYNTTNELEEIARASVSGNDQILEDHLEKLLRKHLVYIQDLNLPPAIETVVNSLLSDTRKLAQVIKKDGFISPKNMDSLYSIGELLSSQLIACFFQKNLPKKKVKFFDARLLIKTNSSFNNAIPQKNEIKSAVDLNLASYLIDDSLLVIPGFIGANEKGETTTLGREGSDFSAALLAEAIGATELQIWKDVPGIFTGDPKLIKNARPVAEISFEEVNKFSEKGAKILFPSALIPVMESNIPVYIGWIHDHKKGTKIYKKIDKAPKLIGITHQRELIRYELEKKSQDISLTNFMRNIKTILNTHKVGYQAIFEDGERVNFHILIKDRFPESALAQLEEFSLVSKFPNISLISIVGQQMEYFSQKILKLVSDLEKDGISLILVEESSDSWTFAFPSRVDEKVLNFVHDELFLNR
jgi:aspartate kinase